LDWTFDEKKSTGRNVCEEWFLFLIVPSVKDEGSKLKRLCEVI
jgi:hypothetical protein